MSLEDITVVTYLTEKHKHWIPHWCKQLNAQTTRGFEIMLVFHNWTPDTLELNELTQDLDDDLWDNLSTYICHSEPVIGAVIDFALSRLDTEYFAHWDVDDVFHPQRLALQSVYLDANTDIDFLGTRMLGFLGEPRAELLDVSYVKPDELNAHVTEHNEIYDCIMNRNENCLGHSSMIYKAEVMRRLGGFSRLNVMTDPLGRSPDFETWKKALMAGYKFHRLPELLVLWRLDSSAIRDVSNAKE